MKTLFKTSFLVAMLSLGSFTTGCAGEDPNSGKSQSEVTGQKCTGDVEEANDKVVCSADSDCDSDEFCLNGKCTGYDGDVEDDECQPADDAADDEGGADKITCSVDADCDSDEFCSSGLCTGLDGDTE